MFEGVSPHFISFPSRPFRAVPRARNEGRKGVVRRMPLLVYTISLSAAGVPSPTPVSEDQPRPQAGRTRFETDDRSVATHQEAAAHRQGCPQRYPGRDRLRPHLRRHPRTTPGPRHQAERGGARRDIRCQPHHHSPRPLAPGPRAGGAVTAEPRRGGRQPEHRRGPADPIRPPHSRARHHRTGHRQRHRRASGRVARDGGAGTIQLRPWRPGRRHPPVRRVPPEACRDGAQRSSGEFPAQPGVADLADHRPVRKRRSLALLVRRAQRDPSTPSRRATRSAR